MHKNCCHQNCSFWLRYVPNHLSAGASLTALPQTPYLVKGVGPPGKWKEGGEVKSREGGEGGEGRGGSPGMPKSRVGKPTLRSQDACQWVLQLNENAVDYCCFTFCITNRIIRILKAYLPLSLILSNADDVRSSN